MTADDAQPTRRGVRGAGFPAISLPEAVAIIATAAAAGRVHGLAALAAYAGHVTANSGPFRQKLAALKDWGLVTTSGDTATITEAGMGIALPSSPESRLDFMLRAFQGCGIFWRMYEEAAKGVALYPSSIGNVAVTAHGVGVRAKEAFIKSFIDSAATVGLAEKLPNGEVKLLAMTPRFEAPTEAAPVAPAPQTGELRTDTGKAPVAEDKRVQPPAVHQTWEDAHATIELTITVAAPLSATAFMQIGEVVTAIETLREILASG